MARKQTAPVSAQAARPPRASAKASSPASKNGAKNGSNGATHAETAPRAPRAPDAGKVAEAKRALLERGARALDGALELRADPLHDALAAPPVVEAARAHGVELARRGLDAASLEAALALSQEMESALRSLPAQGVSARGRSAEEAELIEEAALVAHSARDAVLRVTRGADGREAAHAFGLGETFNVRQAAHVVRGLKRLLEGAKAHPEVARDAGLLADDLQQIKALLGELDGMPGVAALRTDETEKLHAAHAALRAFFDLFAAKATLALAADPEERARVLALLPRAHERRRNRFAS